MGYRHLLLHAGQAAVVPDWDGRLGGDAIRLDAYDANAGAGGFYARYGFTKRGRVVYRGDPLVYYERLLMRELLDATRRLSPI